MSAFTDSAIWTIFNSNLFVGFVTLLVGSSAYVLYRAKNAAFKRDAASIILIEIQNAQRRLREAIKHLEEADNNERVMIAEDILLMPTESWSKYKYLFIRDLERDDWDTVSTFYERTKLYDDAVNYNNQGPQKMAEQIRTRQAESAMGFIFKFVEEYPDATQGSPEELYAIRKAAKANAILLENLDLVGYMPRKPVIDARAQLRIIGTYEMSPITIKLQKIIQSGSWWRKRNTAKAN